MKQDNTNGRIDRAWNKMVLTLDEKLPVKDDKDRKFILLLWFLLGLIAINLLYFGLNDLSNQSQMSSQGTKSIVELNNSQRPDSESNIVTTPTEISENGKRSKVKTELGLTESTHSLKKDNSIPYQNRDSFENFENEQSLKKDISDQYSHALQKVNKTTYNTTEIPPNSFPQNSNEDAPETELTQITKVTRNTILISKLQHIEIIPSYVIYYPRHITPSLLITNPVVEIQKPQSVTFVSGVEIFATRATDLKMWGILGRISGSLNMNKTSLSLFGGYGYMWKSATQLDESSGIPIAVEDLGPSNQGSDFNDPGQKSYDLTENLRYLDFGIGIGYQLNRPFSISLNGGLTKYFRPDPVDILRIDSNALGSEFFETYNILVENNLNPFAELNLQWNINHHLGLQLVYHHEFNPLIDQDDASFYGQRIHLGLGYNFN